MQLDYSHSQGGSYLGDKPVCYATLAITVNKVFAAIPYQVEGGTETMGAPESIIAWGIEKANNKTQICLLNKKDWLRPSDYQFFIAFCV